MKNKPLKVTLCSLLTTLIPISPVNAVELKHTFGSIKAGYANWDLGFEDTKRGSLWKVVGDYGLFSIKASSIHSTSTTDLINQQILATYQ